jgi:AP-3 complex subunit beta
LDHEQRVAMTELLPRLLNDRSTMVLGAAVETFNQVCPERLDMIDSVFERFDVHFNVQFCEL